MPVQLIYGNVHLTLSCEDDIPKINGENFINENLNMSFFDAWRTDGKSDFFSKVHSVNVEFFEGCAELGSVDEYSNVIYNIFDVLHSENADRLQSSYTIFDRIIPITDEEAEGMGPEQRTQYECHRMFKVTGSNIELDLELDCDILGNGDFIAILINDNAISNL